MHIDPCTLGGLVAPLRHAVGAAGFAHGAAAALAPVFRASRAVFVQRPLRASISAPLSSDDVHFIDWPLWCKPHYCQHLRARDPIRRWVQREDISHQGGAVRLSDLVPARKMVCADYYKTMLQPSGAAHVLALAIGGSAQPSGVLSLVRDSSAGDFSDDECQLAAALAPWLALAYALASERGLRGSDAQDLAHALDGEIVFACDAAGPAGSPPQWRAITSAARQIERAWHAAGLVPSALHTLHSASMLADAHSLALELPIAGPCALRWTHDAAGRRAGLLIVALHRQSPAPASHAFAALTAREQQVLDLVLRGHANKHIARILGTSPWTVKNQMRAVLRKTRTRSRTELCAVAAARDQAS